jgi:SAM-dependent methyltransferase
VASDVPERFDPATMHGEIIHAEHVARYRWAASLAHGRRTLDAGCGTAYGSALLAAAGASAVVGVDLAADVLDDARPRMPANVTLESGDVTALPCEDASFDLVVCFEVIEHLEERSRALDEFRRVLAPGGLLALSSPNREVYPPGNPHHVHEYTPDELEAELASRFEFVSLSRQHTWIGSAVLDDETFRTGEDGDLGACVGVRKLAADEPGAELYTVALASATPLPDPVTTLELATAVELRRWDELWHEQAMALEHQERLLREQAELLTEHDRVFAQDAINRERLWNELAELRAQLARIEPELARVPALDAQLAELVQLNDELAARNAELRARQESYDQLVETAERYTVLVGSSSWRLTRPLRALGALARKLRG